MKIGLMRFSQSYDINWIFGSAGTKAAELRLGILEALVLLGHEPVILNTLKKNDEFLLKNSGVYEGYDYGFLSKVQWSPEQIPSLDAVIVEGSIDNIMYALDGAKRFAEVLKQFEGPVVIFHHGDQNCSVPIGEIKRALEQGPTEETTQINYRNLFQGTPWRPEQFHLWTPGLPNLLSSLPSVRRGYNYIVSSQIKQITLGYSQTFDRSRNTEITWDKADLIYVGDERSPEKSARMEKLYGADCKHCTKLLYGKWEDIPRGFDYRGHIPGFGMVYSLLPQARSSITVVREWCTDHKLPTTRTIQTICAGLLTFCDSDEKSYMTEYLDEENFVNTHDEWHDKSNYLSSLDQQEKLKPWTTILEPLLVSLG